MYENTVFETKLREITRITVFRRFRCVVLVPLVLWISVKVTKTLRAMKFTRETDEHVTSPPTLLRISVMRLMQMIVISDSVTIS